jgi:hypothetical protein
VKGEKQMSFLKNVIKRIIQLFGEKVGKYTSKNEGTNGMENTDDADNDYANEYYWNRIFYYVVIPLRELYKKENVKCCSLILYHDYIEVESTKVATISIENLGEMVNGGINYQEMYAKWFERISKDTIQSSMAFEKSLFNDEYKVSTPYYVTEGGYNFKITFKCQSTNKISLSQAE